MNPVDNNSYGDKSAIAHQSTTKVFLSGRPLVFHNREWVDG